jgi:hypothetical protein
MEGKTCARKRNSCSSSGFTTTPSTDGDRGQKYRCFSESESGSDNLIFGLIPICTANTRMRKGKED